jgi:hypothetical protein
MEFSGKRTEHDLIERQYTPYCFHDACKCYSASAGETGSVKSVSIKSFLATLTIALTANALASSLPCTDHVSVASMLGSSCAVGGTTFSNFDYTVSGSGADLAPPASDIYVDFGNGPLMLVFTASWYLDGQDVGHNSYNAFIDFDVLAPENFLITSVGLSASGYDTRGSVGKVIETISDGVNTYSLKVSGFPLTTTTLSDSLTFVGVPEIHVTKKIQVGQGNGFDSISQSFTLIDPPAGAPEPSSMLLIGAGLVALGMKRSWKKPKPRQLD